MSKKAVCCLVLLIAVDSATAFAEERKPWLGMALLLRDAPGGGKFLVRRPRTREGEEVGIRLVS
jgi:hypothetical protein